MKSLFSLILVSTFASSAFAAPGHKKDAYTCYERSSGQPIVRVMYETGRYPNVENQQLLILANLEFDAGNLAAGSRFMDHSVPESVDTDDCTDGSSVFVNEPDSDTATLMFYCAIDSVGISYQKISNLRCE